MLAGAAGDAMALAGEAGDTLGNPLAGRPVTPCTRTRAGLDSEEPTSKLRSTPEEASNVSARTRAHPASAG